MPVSRHSRPSALQSRTEVAPISKAQPKPSNDPRSSQSKRVDCLAWWCGKSFGRYADMRKHVDSKHLGFFWKCAYPNCKEESAQKANLETHIKNVHTRELSSTCTCGKGFTDPSMLSRHRKSTGHQRNRNAKRSSSGAAVLCRLPDTLDVTVQSIMDPLYIPKLFDTTYDHSVGSKPGLISSLSWQRPQSPSYSSSGCSSNTDVFPLTPEVSSPVLSNVIVSSSPSPSPFHNALERHKPVPGLSDFEWPNVVQETLHCAQDKATFNPPVYETPLVPEASEWTGLPALTVEEILSILSQYDDFINVIPAHDPCVEGFQLQDNANHTIFGVPDYQPEDQFSSFDNVQLESVIDNTVPNFQNDDFSFGELSYSPLQIAPLYQYDHSAQQPQVYFSHDLDFAF